MRRLRRIVLSFFTGVVLLVVSVALYLFVFGGLEQVLNQQLRQLAGPQNNLELYIGKISGDFLSGIELENVAVHYIDSSTQYLIAEIPRLEVAYSIRNLWNKNYILSYLHMESAALTLREDSEGCWLLPTVSSKGQSKPAGVLPPLAAEKLLVTDLSVRIIKQDDTLTFENVNFSAAVRAEAGTYAISLDRFEFESNEERIVLDAAEGKLTYAEKKLIFKDLLIVSDEMRVRFGGHVNLEGRPTGEIEFSGDNVNLEDIAAYVGPRLKGVIDANGRVSFDGSRLAGRVDLGGRFMIADIENLLVDFRFEDKQLYLDTLYGTILGNCAIDGSGQIDFTNKPEQYRLDASIKNFDLKQLVTHTFHSDLTGSLALRGESFGKKTMVLNVQTELYESSFDEYPMHYAIGDIIITTDSLVFVDSFRVDYFENIFFVDGPIVYSDSLDLDIRVFLNQLDRYTEKVFINKPAGRAYSRARLDGKTNDPDLSGYFVSDSLWIYGLYCDSFYATFDLARFLTGRRGEVEADFFSGNAWEVPYDTGYLHLQLDSNIVTFDSTFLAGRNSFLSALGVLDTKSYPQQLRGDSLTLIVFGQPFANRGPVTIEIDSAGFDFCDFTIGSNGAQLSVLGRVDYDESMDLAVSVVHVQAAPWINLFEKEWSLDGIVSCEAMLRGNFMKPEFTASGMVDSLVYRGLVLGDLATLVDYNDRLLTIDSLHISSKMGAYRASGSLYADLAFTTDSIQRLPDRPMDIRMEANDTRFDLVTLMLPSVEQLEGDFSADIKLSGTPYEPHLEGGAFIRKARLKYFDLEEPVFADSVAVSMQDNRIIIDDVDVFISDRHDQYAEASRDPGHNRHAAISGEIEVRGINDLFYDIDVTIPEEIAFTYELDDIKGMVSGLVHIEGETPPLVSGDIDVANMKYEVNFAEVDEGSPIMAALSGENVWDLN
ncbi:MAG: translocation/assembly module TamB domain-containing protein, partial [candidate division Zixibacteria bacterium]|nr:translocation/assembly module TamB domain-containing protein [candidate division Zixibacteria bacterium]